MPKLRVIDFQVFCELQGKDTQQRFFWSNSKNMDFL